MFYAVIPNHTFRCDKERQTILANKLNSKIYNKISLKIFRKSNFKGIFFTDEISTIDLIKIFYICFFNKKIIINVLFLELYSITFLSMFQKIFNF